MLEIRNLNLSLGDRVIFKDLNLTINPGEVYALLGRNGTGKSTLASVIVGTMQPDSGDILFDGERINDLSITERAKRGIILGWQKNIVVEGLTTDQYLRISSPKPVEAKDVDDYLTQVGLLPCDYRERFLDGRLSGGERKRIELASVLATRPRLAILDEPDSGIDAVSLVMIIDVIHELAARGGAVLLITHQPDVIRVSNRAGLLCGSNMLREGKPDSTIRYFKQFCDICGTVNAPPPEAERGKAQ